MAVLHGEGDGGKHHRDDRDGEHAKYCTPGARGEGEFEDQV